MKDISQDDAAGTLYNRMSVLGTVTQGHDRIAVLKANAAGCAASDVV